MTTFDCELAKLVFSPDPSKLRLPAGTVITFLSCNELPAPPVNVCCFTFNWWMVRGMFWPLAALLLEWGGILMATYVGLLPSPAARVVLITIGVELEVRLNWLIWLTDSVWPVGLLMLSNAFATPAGVTPKEEAETFVIVWGTREMHTGMLDFGAIGRLTLGSCIAEAAAWAASFSCWAIPGAIWRGVGVEEDPWDDGWSMMEVEEGTIPACYGFLNNKQKYSIQYSDSVTFWLLDISTTLLSCGGNQENIMLDIQVKKCDKLNTFDNPLTFHSLQKSSYFKRFQI